MAVISTDYFDEFIPQNRLDELDLEGMSDDRIGLAFQKAELPVELLGDLRALISQVTTPLAIRSSSLLEDALGRPFAGVYATKMIPNNQLDIDTRFRQVYRGDQVRIRVDLFQRGKRVHSDDGPNPPKKRWQSSSRRLSAKDTETVSIRTFLGWLVPTTSIRLDRPARRRSG